MRRVDLNELSRLSLRPPDIADQELKDLTEFVIITEYTWKICLTEGKVVIPEGFVTDYASIPSWAAHFGFPKRGPSDAAAAIHDYFYWMQKCSRREADKLMRLAMKESQVDWFRRNVIYFMVRAFGCFAWKNNVTLWTDGYLKIIPPKFIATIGPDVKWTDLREKFRTDGIKEPTWEDHGEYGKYADLC